MKSLVPRSAAFLLLWTLAAILPSVGQRPRLDARLVPDSIAIGDHFELQVTIEKDMMQVVSLPEFKDNIIGDVIEVLSESPLDTVETDGRRVKLQKRYTLTTFDEGIGGIHPLGQFPILYADKNITDTIWSEATLLLKVGTFEIDTVKQTIVDIKRPMDAPLKVGEIGGYILWGLLALLAIAVLIWWVISKRRNLTLFGKPKYVEPPHVSAIKALEILHNQKLWQNNKHKAYYTRLTDILREYADGRYGIRAMEMTSDEIMDAMVEQHVPEKNCNDLRNILSTADFVKFAKYVPPQDDNETLWSQAYYFVEDTKPTEEEPAGIPEENQE